MVVITNYSNVFNFIGAVDVTVHVYVNNLVPVYLMNVMVNIINIVNIVMIVVDLIVDKIIYLKVFEHGSIVI